MFYHQMLTEKLKNIPSKPGVYFLKDKTGLILYVGKARILKNRLRSHFNPGSGEDRKHRLMMARVRDFEIIVTDSEVEALILEANLVKEHSPRYNINLKDDKSYPYIRVTNETYPRIFITRKIVRDGSRYFGPYTDVGSIRQLMTAVRRIFPVRTCNLHITEQTIRNKKHKVCLNFHIGRCYGPCEGLISQKDYLWTVKQVVAFIQGKNNELVQDLEKRMKRLAKDYRYEEAARLRNAIHSISTFQSKQKVVGQVTEDRDLITVAAEGEDACGVVFDVREGKITNRHHFYMGGVENKSDTVILNSFIKQYYLRTDYIPAEIYLSLTPVESQEVKSWLSQKRGKKVDFVVPRRGKKMQLMDMCAENARLLLKELQIQKIQASNWTAPSVRALQKDLKLEKPPKRIEAFDVSNTAGTDAVASMVVFENGIAKKTEYRKFKIKSVKGIDDFQMIAEAVERRIVRLIKEEKNLPDLILVDGGKGQLSAVSKILKKLSISEQHVIGLAKRLEEVYIPGISDPQTLPKSSASLRLLQRVRDEAHRFALTYHRTLRRKRTVSSELDKIHGIGEKRRRALLKQFGSVQRIQNASLEEIAAVEGMNKSVAEKVLEELNKIVEKNKFKLRELSEGI